MITICKYYTKPQLSVSISGLAWSRLGVEPAELYEISVDRDS